MSSLELKIEGMSCGHCVAAVSKALHKLPGVQVQDVKVGSAKLNYDPQTIQPGKITHAVEEAGYAVQGV